MSPLVVHLIRRAFRSLWENLYLNMVAVGVIATGLLLVGLFLTVIFNVNSIVDDWERDVHISAYFNAEIPVERRFEVKEAVAAMPEVKAVRYISEVEARQYLVEKVPEVAPVMAELGEEVLPASLEITLDDSLTRPGAVEEMAQKLAFPEFQDLDYGQQWVERFNSFLSLLKLLGLVLGGLVALSTVFLVANTINLVVYNRRDELEIMRLVGATWTFIATPFLIEGFIQGVVGAGLSLGGLVLVHHSLVVRLQNALQLSVSEDPLRLLAWDKMALIVVTGAVLGVLGSGSAVLRFMRRIP